MVGKKENNTNTSQTKKGNTWTAVSDAKAAVNIVQHFSNKTTAITPRATIYM